MNELIPINYDGEQPTVSARELHKSLEISKRFSAWFETNSQGFIENEDYTSVLTGTEVQNNGGVQIRELQDYSLSVEFWTEEELAKENNKLVKELMNLILGESKNE